MQQIKESNEIRCEKNILHKEKDNAENESSLKNTNIIIDTDKNQCATAQSLFIDVKTIAWNEHDFNGMEMSILGEESGNDGKNSLMTINTFILRQLLYYIFKHIVTNLLYFVLLK